MLAFSRPPSSPPEDGPRIARSVEVGLEGAVFGALVPALKVEIDSIVEGRFVAEREDRHSLEDALAATITGTGGALLGSALTTAAGFGVLALALAPPLQRFGLVTGLSIVFAFVACLTVLPCLLVVRERVLMRMESRE